MELLAEGQLWTAERLSQAVRANERAVLVLKPLKVSEGAGFGPAVEGSSDESARKKKNEEEKDDK